MSSDEDEPPLKDLVTDLLKSKGILGKIQAQLRAAVYLSLEEELNKKNAPLVDSNSSQMLSSKSGLLSLAIVKDFMSCLGLEFTLSVLETEANVSSKSVLKSRNDLLTYFKLDNKSNSEIEIPVLNRIIEKFLHSHEDSKLNGESSKSIAANGLQDVACNSEEALDVRLTINSNKSEKINKDNFLEKTKDKNATPTNESDSDSIPNSLSQKYEDQFTSESEGKESSKIEEILEDLSIGEIIDSEESEHTQDFVVAINGKRVADPHVCDYEESL